MAGTATGTINYSFWWNCNDTGSSVENVKLVCGDPNDPAFGAKFDAVNDNPEVVSHTYPAAGNYTAKVIVERGTAAPFERRASVTVTSPPPTPTPTPTTNPYVRIDQIYKLSDGETTYINVKWTLLQKWNLTTVAVYPSLNGNLPGTTLSSVFVPEQMGGNYLYYNDFISLGRSLDNGFYMWKTIGTGGCSTGGPGPDDYEVGQQYTTRFSRVFDMSTFRSVNGEDITSASDLRFTVYDKTQFDGSPCNMDNRVAYPDNTDFHVQPTGTADSAIATSVSPNPIVTGDNFTYSVTLKNNGPDAALSVNVFDYLPPSATLVSCSTSGQCTNDGNKIRVYFDSIASGATETINIVGAEQCLGATITNVARVSTVSSDPVAGNNSAALTTAVSGSATAQCAADVIAGQSDTSDSTNNDNANAYAQPFVAQQTAQPTELQVRLAGFYNGTTFSPSLHAEIYQTDNPNDANDSNRVAASGNVLAPCESCTTDMTFHFSGAPTLQAGVVYTWIIFYHGASGNGRGTNDNRLGYIGWARIGGWEQGPVGDTASTNYSFLLKGQLPPSANLSITQSASANPAELGRIFTYNIVAANAGPSDATGVAVTDALPPGVTFSSATTTRGSCAFSSGTLTCQLGSLAANGSASVALQVKPRQTGPLSNTASVTAVEDDPDTSNNSAPSNINVIKTADLKVAKTDSADPIFVGEQTTYTMLLTNLGTVNGATGVVLTDNLPASMTFVSATTSQGSLVTPPVGSNGIVTANLGSLAVNAQATVTVTVKANAPGVITNTAQVSANETDPTPANNAASQATTVKSAALQKVLLASQVLTGGCQNTTGQVYLTGPAPPGGLTVPLSSNITGAAVPPTVLVAAGQMVSPNFSVTTSPVTAKQVGLITAGSGAGSVSRGLTVNVGSGVCGP